MNAFSSALGLLMVVTAGATAGPIALGVLGLAAIAVMVGLFDRRAATVAVVASAVALALSQPTPLFAAVSGVSAAAYLVIRHTPGGGVAVTIPTAVGVLGFAVIGLAATALELPVNWIPLLAPVIIAAVLVVAALPLLADRSSDAGGQPGADNATR